MIGQGEKRAVGKGFQSISNESLTQALTYIILKIFNSVIYLIKSIIQVTQAEKKQ